MADVTPDAVLAYDKPTDGFLCPLSANTFGIDFLEIEIKDYDSGDSVFHVKKDPEAGLPQLPPDLDPEIEKSLRTVKYTFPLKFLKFKTVRTALVFGVGANEVPSFRMIERHYFKDELVRSYDFTFGFCIPSSTNSWEAIYPVPAMSEDRIKEMCDSPGATRSDSFYFVDDKLIMHNKAEYSYAP